MPILSWFFSFRLKLKMTLKMLREKHQVLNKYELLPLITSERALPLPIPTMVLCEWFPLGTVSPSKEYLR